MPSTVRFTFLTGLSDDLFSNVRLAGSWDASGRSAAPWSETVMEWGVDDAGGRTFGCEVAFADGQVGTTFNWGILLDGPAGANLWAIAAEVTDEGSASRERSFVLQPGAQDQSYALTLCGQRGATRALWQGKPGLRFSVWAPNARAVDLVLADPALGYVADDGTGALRTIAMKQAGGGIWRVGPQDDPALADFPAMVGTPYLFHVTKDDGSKAYRTDIWSLMQIGQGDSNPLGAPYPGPPASLNGPISCSVVCDPERVVLGPGDEVAADRFWQDEFSPAHALPTRIEDLVIYELHVGALGFGKSGPGTFDDAIAFVDHLVTLGINAVELMPIAEFEDKAAWGYGTSHFFAMDQAAGGTDRLKMFVKACHRQGIAVILDVCYNHFVQDAERVQWAYDSNDPTRNIYYWYEGRPSDYADPTGGYVDNLSTGFAPRFDEEMVRQLFISSAAFLVSVCHVDGFRLDQTSAIHEYPVLHADNGRRVDRAAAFGVKFLKQWTRTMRLIKPGLFLSAEDYSNWSAMTAPSLAGDGLGFDATWYGDFHHNLIEYQDGPQAQLVKMTGFGDARPLAMSAFAGALQASSWAKVVYNQSHDDCGNRQGSNRTIVLAVNGAPLIGETRDWAEARVRFAAGMTMLSAGTPMFFMGEEIGAAKRYTYDGFVANREDILGEALGNGARLALYYRHLIALSERSAAIRTRNIEVPVADDDNRVIGFHRWDGTEAFFVAGNLGGTPFEDGYWFYGDRLGNAQWTEIFNSDATLYGGRNVGNGGRTLAAVNGALNVILPAAGVVVFQRA